jgi:hypothetical protein
LSWAGFFKNTLNLLTLNLELFLLRRLRVSISAFVKIFDYLAQGLF